MQKNYKRAERYMGVRDAEEFVEPYVTSLAPQLLSMMETPQYKHNARQLDLPDCSWQARGGCWKNTTPTARESHASTQRYRSSLLDVFL